MKIKLINKTSSTKKFELENEMYVIVKITTYLIEPFLIELILTNHNWTEELAMRFKAPTKEIQKKYLQNFDEIKALDFYDFITK